MDTEDCIKGRRSVRAFLPDKVKREELEKIISLACWSPSWKNVQGTKYIAVDDEQKIKTIAETMMPVYNQQTLLNAPLMIAVTVAKGKSGCENDGSYTTIYEDRYGFFDAGAACQTFCLAAHNLGIGTVILGVFDIPKIKEYLGITQTDDLVAVIAAGYAKGDSFVMPRKSVKALLKYAD